jgi:hypothetical protein
MNEIVKINIHDYFIIPKGTVVSVSNPSYNEDDPSTHGNIEVVLTSDICVCSADDYQAHIFLDGVKD